LGERLVMGTAHRRQTHRNVQAFTKNFTRRCSTSGNG